MNGRDRRRRVAVCAPSGTTYTQPSDLAGYPCRYFLWFLSSPGHEDTLGRCLGEQRWPGAYRRGSHRRRGCSRLPLHCQCRDAKSREWLSRAAMRNTNGGIGEIDVWNMQPWKARNESGAAVVSGSDWVAVAQHSPAGSMHQLQFFIEVMACSAKCARCSAGSAGSIQVVRFAAGHVLCAVKSSRAGSQSSRSPKKRLQWK